MTFQKLGRICIGWLVVLVFALIAWLLSNDATNGSDDHSEVVASSSNVEDAQLQPTPGLSRRAASDGSWETTTIQRQAAEGSSGSIVVRAELTTVESESGHPPPGCDGWEVIATTLRYRTNEYSHHSARSDASGVAEFHFDEQVHLMQVKCVPPADSALAAAWNDDQLILEVGDDHDLLIHLSDCYAAGGKVIDLDGEPVANAIVHATPYGNGSGLVDWRPGLLTTLTDNGGDFHFDQLHKGVWVASVEPSAWLMINPILEEQDYVNGIVSFWDSPVGEGSRPWDFGTLQVLVINPTTLTVVDSDDRPAAGLYGYVEPLLFNDARLIKTPSSDKNRTVIPMEMAAFMADTDGQGAPAPETLMAADFGVVDGWPYDDVWFLTDSKGQASLPLPEGKWRLHVLPPDGFINADEMPAVEFSTGSGNLFYRLPARVGKVSGRLILRDGRPATYADLYLETEALDGSKLDYGSISRKDGYFEFPALEIGNSFTLNAVPDERYCNFIAREWQLDASADDSDRVYVVDEGLTTSVRFTSAAHDLEAGNFRLQARSWTDGNSALTEHGQPWWNQLQHQLINITDKPVVLPMLPAGTVEFAVLADVGTGAYTDRGFPITKRVEWMRIDIEIGVAGQKFELDLDGYRQPTSSIARHGGVVLDQTTGRPIDGAAVHLWQEGQGSGMASTTTDVLGRFHLETRSGVFVRRAIAAGYSPSSVSGVHYQAGEHHHEILLQPLRNNFTLHVVDRDGAQLPDCTLTFPSPSGDREAVNVQGVMYPTDNFSLSSKNDGQLGLCGMKPGSHRLNVDFWGVIDYDLSFTAPNMEGQTVVVHLPVTLEELREALRAAR